MDGSYLALAVGVTIFVLDYTLSHSHRARQLFASVAGMIPRKAIWLTFIGASGIASHLASWWATMALLVAIGTFGLAMLGWRAASDHG